MVRVLWLASVMIFPAAVAVAQTSERATAEQVNLEGLWATKNRFGPDVRGTLMILPRVGGIVADIAGFSVPVKRQGNSFSFELPDGNGTFRGVRNGVAIEGHWIQRATASNGITYATPVVLRADGRGRWRGQVAALDDLMTYYLPLTRTAAGRYSTYLRNPERNQGLFIGATRLEQISDVVRLVGTRRGQKEESIIGTGRRDPDSGLLAIPIQGETFNFARDTDKTSAFYPRSNPPERYNYSPPVQLDDGWPVSTLEKEGIDQAAIEKFVQKLIDMPMETVSSSQIHSLLVARHGKLVLEEYFHGYDRDEPHDTRSASKSWTNVLIGAAMQESVPIRLDTPVYQTMLGQVPTDLDPRKKIRCRNKPKSRTGIATVSRYRWRRTTATGSSIAA
jgi:hypothetical protein